LLERKGYDVRQVPFRNGGVEPDLVAPLVDSGTVLVAFSGVQTATGHRSEITAISALARAVGAIVFVDGSQLVGALHVAHDLAAIDVLATADHKYLGHAGRGLGYCYFGPAVRERFVPLNAGWKAGRVPVESFFGPTMDLSPTASRFDNSISWIAAIGNEAALATFAELGAEAVFERNRELAEKLRVALSEVGRAPLGLPERSRSTIVSVPVGATAPGLVETLAERGVVAAARDGNLRFSVHVYNHEDDITRLTRALAEL
jgi:selenocysteine lyase/cysteine desulfurase